MQHTHEKMFNISNHQKNTNQNHCEIALHTTRMSIVKTMDNVKCWTLKKLEPSCTADGNAKWAVPQKLNLELLYNPEIPLFSIYPAEMKTYPHKTYI